MKSLLAEVIEELKKVFLGKTVDALIPPLLFFVFKDRWTLTAAVFFSMGVAFLLAVFRFSRGEKWQYALAGFSGVALAGGFALLSQTATDFFLPRILLSGAVVILLWVSLLLRRPFAAWLSHLTRGWTLSWFWRKDVRPAYSEVTLFWSLFLLLRFLLQVELYRKENVAGLFWLDFLLDLPATIAVLTLSYLYGIWRLKGLKGPGIDEYDSKAAPPWRGQRRGF